MIDEALDEIERTEEAVQELFERLLGAQGISELETYKRAYAGQQRLEPLQRPKRP